MKGGQVFIIVFILSLDGGAWGTVMEGRLLAASVLFKTFWKLPGLTASMVRA